MPQLLSSLRGQGGSGRSSGPGDHRKQRPQGLVLQLERDLLSKDLWGAGLLPCCPLP